MAKYDKLADEKTLNTTVQALKQNGFQVTVVDNSKEAKDNALKLIPMGSEVMTMTSVTLDTIGLSEELNIKDGKYHPVRDKLYAMDRSSQAREMNRLGSAPQYVVGSVHAVTKDGHVLIASNTGSQLPSYAYGALNVIWVAGTQKIVENTADGMKRIYEYCLPLENERAKKAYSVPGSAINKILIIDKETQAGRIKIILVKEKLGY